MSTTRNSVEYLLRSSDAALESFQLAQLTRSANLRKDLLQVVNDIVISETEARAARWLRDRRIELHGPMNNLRSELFPFGRDSSDDCASRRLTLVDELPSDPSPLSPFRSLTPGRSAADSRESSRDSFVPLATEAASSRQLQLFSSCDGVELSITFGAGQETFPVHAEKEIFRYKSGVAGEFVQPNAVQPPKSFHTADDPAHRLPRSMQLIRHTLNSSSTISASRKEELKLRVVVLPASRWNIATSLSEVACREGENSATCSNCELISISDRKCRKEEEPNSKRSSCPIDTEYQTNRTVDSGGCNPQSRARGA